MSNNEALGNFSPSFASGSHESQTSELSVAQAHPSGWDNVVAAVRSAAKKKQALLLTLTADNMSPIWLDMHTKRYFTETALDELPTDTLNPKLYAKLIDPNDPPFPWVNWRSLDAILWTIGEKAFETKRARWLILGERYSLMRWPNLTQISYGPDELNAVSMLANGLLTIDELALVARISVEQSQQLISTLSFMGVLRGTGAPRIPVKIAEAMRDGVTQSFEELQRTPIETQEAIASTDYVELPEESIIMDEESSNVLSDADHVRQQLERPAISSMSLPELPDDIFTHRYDKEEEVVEEDTSFEEQPEAFEQNSYGLPDLSEEPTESKVEEKPEPVEEAKSYREETAARFSSMPSFESILAQQNIESAATRSVAEEEKAATVEKPSGGLFGMLRRLRNK